jgi:RHS repeat-associated protein
VLTEYVYAAGRMLAQETGGKVTYYHQDRLSARLLTDGAGNVVAQMSHEPFGEKLLEREEVNKWRFTTYERDAETGTDYAVNRQYAMSIGRFMRPDPVAGSIADPQSLNRYAYVGNDPVNSVDPEGLLIISPSIIQSISDWYYNVVNVSAGGSSIGPGGWGFGGGGSLGGGIGPGDGGRGGGAGGGGPQNPGQQRNNRTDCQKFADMVEQIANDTIGTRPDTPGLDIQTFMDRLATTFTEFSAARLGAVTGFPGEGVNRNSLTFGSSGFAQQFFESGGNQVRHAAGGLIAGYVGIPLHDPVFGLGMNDREDPNDPIHGVPDINLNNRTIPMGNRIGMAAGGSMFGPSIPTGAQAVKGLANWIRNTLCNH